MMKQIFIGMFPAIITGTAAPPSSPDEDRESGSLFNGQETVFPLGERLRSLVGSEGSGGDIAMPIPVVSGWSVEFAAVLLLGIGCILVGIAFGRCRLSVLALASYVGTVSFIAGVSLFAQLSPSLRLACFFSLTILSFFLIARTVCRHKSGSLDRHIAGITFIAVSLSGFLISTLLVLIVPDQALDISPIAGRLFVAADARIVWSVLPVISIGLFRRSHA